MPVEYHVLRGGAAQEIVRYARESDVDLIVMATRGRRGLARLMVGSLAESVFSHAPCPVLVRRALRPKGRRR